MNPGYFGVSDKTDPKNINLNDMNIAEGHKNLLKSLGFDVNDKLTKKPRHGFAYEKLVSDSRYFAAYKKLDECITETSTENEDMVTYDMETACGRQWTHMKSLAIEGELRYYNIHSTYFNAVQEKNRNEQRS